MPSIGLSQLRRPRRLLAWLRAGKTVDLTDRGKVIARFIPERQDGVEWPDFRARRRKIFGEDKNGKS